jgi:hypothetical protein
MPNKQGYQYIMASKHLFVFRTGIIEYFSEILVCIKLKQSQYYQCIMHASKDASEGFTLNI